MEANTPKQQQQTLIKKEPLRVRSYSSLRQHEQQQIAASLRGFRAPGLVPHQGQLHGRPEAQGGGGAPKQHQQPMRPFVPFPSVGSNANAGAGGPVVKFMPNLNVKTEQAGALKTANPAATASSGLGVDALLLRSLHNRQPTQQGSERFGRPKLGEAFRQPSHSLQTQTQQGPIFPQNDNKSNNTNKKRGPRSIKLSDLAYDDSSGHLFLPITIPFNQNINQKHQQQTKREDAAKTPNQEELQEADTAASTPNYWARSTSTEKQPESLKASQTQTSAGLCNEEVPAASLLQEQFLASDGDRLLDEDGRPEFVQLCFPELLPPLDIPAMQAREASETNAQPNKKEQQSKTRNGCNRDSTPTPFHGLPSGRIGQLLIRRSGRVHLRLLTEASCKAADASPAQPPQPEMPQGGPGAAAKLRSGDICYDVLVGTEGSFAQEVGCMLSDTNEFIFLGRCTRKLIVTADIARAIAPLTQRKC